MAVDLRTAQPDTPSSLSLLQQQQQGVGVSVATHLRSHNRNNPNHYSSSSLLLNPHDTQTPLPQKQGIIMVQDNKDVDDDDHQDFVADLARQMAHSMLQDDDHHHTLHFSTLASLNVESPWDSMGSPQSTLWSSLGSQCSSTASPEPSSPPGDHGSCCDKMRLDERDNCPKCRRRAPHHRRLEASDDVGLLCPTQSLIHQQIPTIQQRSGLKEYRSSPVEKNIQQFQKKGFGNYGRSRSIRLPQPQPPHPPPPPPPPSSSYGSRGTSCGTGFFMPRGRTNASSEPRKGCTTILIPARVVQALQLTFDQMAATSGPKAPIFPPLQDVLVSNRDGMYSLPSQKRKEGANMKNELILPQEWTY